MENITFFLDFFFTVPSNSPISGLPQNNYISLRFGPEKILPWEMRSFKIDFLSAV